MTPIIDILHRIIVGAPIMWLAWFIARHPSMFDFTRFP
jgi:hypothetical protein